MKIKEDKIQFKKFRLNERYRLEKGQVALIVLLISAVMMTLGLSLSRKTVVETKIDTDQELLRQAFDAAESGIDYYMATQKDKYTTEGVGTSVEAEVAVGNIGGGESINYDEYTLPGQATLYWLVDHLGNGDLGTGYYGGNFVDICVGNDFNGSLKIDYFYLAGGQYRVDRLAYNYGVNPAVVQNPNSFQAETTCEEGRKGIKLQMRTGASNLLLSVTPLFSGTRFSISGNSNFPVQGMDLTSTGIVGRDQAAGISGVSRIIRVSNRFRIPSFMIDAVTSGGSVMSN